MSPRLKDYFYFNRTEKQSILALLVILFGLIIFLFLDPFSRINQTEDYKKLELVQQYLDSLNQQKESRLIEEELLIKNEDEKNQSELFDFDPNEIGVNDWQKFGLSEKQANTIINYLNKGGSFRIKSDLKKMYSISDSKYKELEPYLLLPDTFEKKRYIKKEYETKKWQPVTVKINSADSATFVKLRGIGPTYASRIIKYRTNLGGFHSLMQLSEVYGISDSLIKTFSEQLILDSIAIKMLDINKLEAKELKVNPYIDWNVANSIVNYRKQHGLYSQIEGIKMSVLINDSLFRKIEPYIHIEK